MATTLFHRRINEASASGVSLRPGWIATLALTAAVGLMRPATVLAEDAPALSAADVAAIVEPLISAETAKILEASSTEAARLGERLDAMGAELEALRQERQARDKAVAAELAAMAARVDRAAAEVIASERVTVRRMTDRDADTAKTLARISKDLSALAARVEAKLDADEALRLLGAQADKLHDEIEVARSTAESAEIVATTAAERAAKSAKSASADIDRLRAAFSEKADAIASLKNDLAVWRTQPGASVKPADEESRTAAEAAAPSGPAPTDSDLTSRLEALEGRAAEAIAILDQRIDQIAKEAQPRALSLQEEISARLAGMYVRFSSSAEPASRDVATSTLQRVAEIALGLPEELRLRIVGYADSDGTVEANRITSKRRSDWARDQLVALGVPPERMTSVGRGAERLLSADASDDSPNRRVEFEAYAIE